MAKVEQELTELSRRMVKVKRFTELGEPLDGDLPIEEADRIKAENDKAIMELGGLIIGTLEDPGIAKLILEKAYKDRQGRRYENIYLELDSQNIESVSTHIDLVEVKESSYQVLLDCNKRTSDTAELEQVMKSRYRDGNLGWSNYKDRDWIHLVRQLKPADLLYSSSFEGFILGSNKLFGRAINQIHSMTLAEREAQRLETLTLACRGATQMITNARIAYLASAQ